MVIFITGVLLGSILGIASGQANKCVSKTCQNNGVCYVQGGQEICRCVGDYAGPLCQYTDPCKPDPCQNSATCEASQNFSTYACKCLVGFTGKNCENKYDACASSPCANGGTCYRNGTDFVCHCLPGWSGHKCEDSVGACKTSPCNSLDSGAVCSKDDPGYSCECSSEDYFGLNCEGKTEDCEKDEESYCICEVNNLLVKMPFPKPHEYHGVRTQDIIDAVIGLIVGFALGSLALWLYHCCCAGHHAVPERPPTSSSMRTTSTKITNRSQISPSLDSNSTVSSPKTVNVYRAAFNDEGTSHKVATRKSPMTYVSGDHDW